MESDQCTSTNIPIPDNDSVKEEAEIVHQNLDIKIEPPDVEAWSNNELRLDDVYKLGPETQSQFETSRDFVKTEPGDKDCTDNTFGDVDGDLDKDMIIGKTKPQTKLALLGGITTFKG